MAAYEDIWFYLVEYNGISSQNMKFLNTDEYPTESTGDRDDFNASIDGSDDENDDKMVTIFHFFFQPCSSLL